MHERGYGSVCPNNGIWTFSISSSDLTKLIPCLRLQYSVLFSVVSPKLNDISSAFLPTFPTRIPGVHLGRTRTRTSASSPMDSDCSIEEVSRGIIILVRGSAHTAGCP